MIIARHCDQNLKRYYTSVDFIAHIDCFKKLTPRQSFITKKGNINIYGKDKTNYMYFDHNDLLVITCHGTM